jgi:hypothetical protein
MSLFTGTYLARGCRVGAALRASGNYRVPNWSSFHQVLNRAQWSQFSVSRQLLVLIVETFVPAGGSRDLVIDETLSAAVGQQDRASEAITVIVRSSAARERFAALACDGT